MRTLDLEANGWSLQRDFPTKYLENVREYRGGFGNVDSAVIAEKRIRTWPALIYKTKKTTDPRISHDYAVGFSQAEVGSAGRFLWKTPEPVPTPFEAPTLSQVVAGTQGARTIFVGFTWKDAAGATTISPLSSLAVVASSLLVVKLPPYPPSVTQAEIFAEQGGGSGDLQSQVVLTENDRSWTQPDAAILLATSSPPTVNTASAIITVKFLPEIFDINRGEGLSWVLRIGLEEMY